MKKEMSYETRFVLTMAIVMVVALIVLVVLNRTGYLGDTGLSEKEQKKEKTIIVSDAEKSSIMAAVQKKVVPSMREVAKQEQMSTSYLQLNRTPPGTPEYEELKHQIESENKLKKRPAVVKVKESPSAPLRYIDKSSPRDRASDAFYLYLLDMGGGVWPFFCVQSVGKELPNLHEFRINADAKTFTFKAIEFKSEKVGKGISQYYDQPFNGEIFAAMQALVKGRKGTITLIAGNENRSRTISEEEIKSLDRMMDTYLALGGNLEMYQRPVGKKK